MFADLVAPFNPRSHRLTRYRRGCRDGASPVTVRAPRLPARERELADHHEERQAKRQARRQEPFHFRRRQGAPAQCPASPLLPPNAPRRHSPTHLAATSQRAAAEPVVHLSRQLRLAMLTWYCAEGSGHVEDRPCQNFNFMHSAAGQGLGLGLGHFM